MAQGDATRAELVRAARELFGEHGYADTSLDEIVTRAGVTKGALYHHFTGKEDLFRAVFEQVHREVTDQVAVVFLGPRLLGGPARRVQPVDRCPPGPVGAAHRAPRRPRRPRVGRRARH